MNTRSIDTAERRRRLAIRHRLSPDHPAGDVVEAASSLVCLHGTDQVTVFLSARARLVEMKVSDVEDALYRKRSLVMQIAIRRTLFVFPRTTLGLAQAGAGNRVAKQERRTLVRDVENAGLHPDGQRWLSETSRQVIATLSDGREATSSELRDEIPLLEGEIEYGQGKSWGGKAPLAPRVLTVLSGEGKLVRATNDGAWSTSRPRWALTEAGSVGRWMRPPRRRESPGSSSSGSAASAQGPKRI